MVILYTYQHPHNYILPVAACRAKKAKCILYDQSNLAKAVSNPLPLAVGDGNPIYSAGFIYLGALG